MKNPMIPGFLQLLETTYYNCNLGKFLNRFTSFNLQVLYFNVINTFISPKKNKESTEE